MSQPTHAEEGRDSYLVLFSKGPNWREGHLFKDQLEAGRHGEYTERLRSEGASSRRPTRRRERKRSASSDAEP